MSNIMSDTGEPIKIKINIYVKLQIANIKKIT